MPLESGDVLPRHFVLVRKRTEHTHTQHTDRLTQTHEVVEEYLFDQGICTDSRFPVWGGGAYSKDVRTEPAVILAGIRTSGDIRASYGSMVGNLLTTVQWAQKNLSKPGE